MANPHQLDSLGFSSHKGLNARVIDYRYRRLADSFRGASCLELGCSDGRGLPMLLERFDTVVAVDGSAEAIGSIAEQPRLKNRKGLRLVNSMFEDLELGQTFETVLLGHILEHVEDPQVVLQVGKRHLAKGGVLIADVPNADSFHRHLGVELGMLESVTDLNEADLSIGHRRVYTLPAFLAELEAAGLNVVRHGGFFFKPFSNAQLEAMLPKQLEALFSLGERFPRNAAEIYAVCE